jgi:flagellar biosynthesis protein FlhF
MSAALAEVKSSMGPGAVILHTRTFSKARWLGLRKQEVVEITAGRNVRVADRPSTKSAPPAPARNTAHSRRQLLDSPAGQGAMMVGLTRELTNLKGMVKDLVDDVNRRRSPQVPEEFLEYYSRLVANQVSPELATEIVQTIYRQIRPEHARQADFVREKLAEQVERMLPTAGPIARTKSNGPHIVALIGPTGVGKTTTIAKLAANLQVRQHHRVGLITIDTYRMAAIDQLRKYATIIGTRLRAIGTPEDLSDVVRSMSDCDYILIDTAGRSPNDSLKLNELKTFMDAAKPDEVHLVLSTTASQQCVELAVDRFSATRVDKLLFTKLDEAAHVGVVLNVVRKVNKGLSYVTTGQDVPDDIEVGDGRRLARMILGQPAVNGQGSKI